jgi:hypothetical protein
MKRVLFILLIAALAFIPVALSAQAAPTAQGPAVTTPTPGADGRIIYIVKAGENCLQISLIFQIPLEQLRSLNRLDEACALQEGQQLLLGFGGPAAASPTPGPSPTPTPIIPTPTPINSGNGNICILLYNDQNGDRLRQETEPAIAGGAISVASIAYSKSQTTYINTDAAAYQGVCFIDIPQGLYTISAGIPDGYNPTTALNMSNIKLDAGGEVFIDFGAQPREEVIIAQEGGNSSALGLVGGALVLIGIGLGIYAATAGRGPRKVNLQR